jgi:hypothetical protein
LVLTRLLHVACFCAVVVAAAGPAHAQRDTTAEAFARLEEILTPQLDNGMLGSHGIFPLMFVSATPAYEETKASYPAAALQALVRIFDGKNIRACEACMNPRVSFENGRLDMNTSSLAVDEIVMFDARVRGKSAPARAAVWLDETRTGVAIRIISLENSQVLFAANIDGALRERSRSQKNFTFTDEIGRRLRGESLTHIFIDAALLPGQHISVDIAEQFGDDNCNLAGITMSVLDPIVGFGAAYHRVIPQAFNLTVGAQVIASLPTAFVSAFAGDVTQVLDPLVVAVLIARFPIPSTNFAAVATVSSKGTVALGVTLMNFSVLPFLP